jgi:hypothetical protein
MSRLHRSLRFLFAFLVVALIATTQRPIAAGAAQEPDVAAASGGNATDPGWPRVIESGDLTLTVYQPQIEKFDGITLEARAAVAVESQDSKTPTYGVIWIHADADVDKEKSLVDLTNIEIVRANFPGEPDRQDEFLTILRENTEASRAISLARVQANLALTATRKESRRLSVKNDPPRIIYDTSPAIVVLVDGQPVLRPAEGSSLERVINTRALVLFDPASRRYELTVMGRWFTAPDIEGPWSPDPDPPAAAEALRQRLASAQDPQVDLLEDPDEEVKKAFELGIAPKIFVSTGPAELIVTQGKPQMQPIPGTELLWVQNSKNKILFDVVPRVVALGAVAIHRERPAAGGLREDSREAPRGQRPRVRRRNDGGEGSRDRRRDSADRAGPAQRSDDRSAIRRRAGVGGHPGHAALLCPKLPDARDPGRR